MLKFARVFKKIADELDPAIFHFKYRNAFILVRLVLPAHSTIRPMDRRHRRLDDSPLNPELQLGEAVEQDPEEPDDLVFPHQGLGLRKIEFRILREEGCQV